MSGCAIEAGEDDCLELAIGIDDCDGWDGCDLATDSTVDTSVGYADAPAGDLSMTSDGAAVDAGVDLDPSHSLIVQDIDGQDRPTSDLDSGADEYFE